MFYCIYLQIMAGATGLEPATLGSTIRYSNQIELRALLTEVKADYKGKNASFQRLLANIIYLGARGVEPRTPSL